MLAENADSDDIDSEIRDLKDSWEERKKPLSCPRCGGKMIYTQDSAGKITWTCPDCKKVVHERRRKVEIWRIMIVSIGISCFILGVIYIALGDPTLADLFFILGGLFILIILGIWMIWNYLFGYDDDN